MPPTVRRTLGAGALQGSVHDDVRDFREFIEVSDNSDEPGENAKHFAHCDREAKTRGRQLVPVISWTA